MTEKTATPRMVVPSQMYHGVCAEGCARSTKIVMGRTDAKPKIAAERMSPMIFVLKTRLGTYMPMTAERRNTNFRVSDENVDTASGTNVEGVIRTTIFIIKRV
jgi:hypothetical protein